MNAASLLILGTGHSEAMEHWNTNALVESHGKRMLIDCGYTIKFALRDQGLSLRDIDAIFITHVHADHMFGLERVAYESRFGFGKRVTLYVAPELQEELWDQSLKGCMGLASEGENTLDDFFDVRLIQNDAFQFEGVDVQLFRTRHTPRKPCFGVHLNQRVIYTSDTLAIPDVIAGLHSDVIFHDVTLRDEHPVHAAVPSLLACYDEMTRRKMYLTSYEDCWREWQSRIEQDFAGFARQGQRIWL